jgi:hypothetical protein
MTSRFEGRDLTDANSVMTFLNNWARFISHFESSACEEVVGKVASILR